MIATSKYTLDKHTIKAVAVDLDGTLLNNQKKVSQHTKKILQHIHKKFGIDIILASGRSIRTIEPVEEELGINCYIICFNGAQCWSKKDELGQRKMLFNAPLPTEHLGDIFKFVNERNLFLNVYLDLVNAIDKPEMRYYAENYNKLTGATYNFVSSYHLLESTQPAKAIIITHDEELCDRLMIEATTSFSSLEIIKSKCASDEVSQFYVEFLQKGTDKGSAIRKWSDCTGVSLEQVIAFGDAENDLGMLKAVKIGICMIQGSHSLREIAHFISEFNNDQDGVARELQHIFELTEV